MIELKHIDKYYNIGTVNEVCLFKDFNLTVDDGDFISVIGSNGSGKTSMLNLICGSLEAEAGNIILNGMESDYSLYSQDFSTFDEDTVYNQKDAEGFINLFGLPIKIESLLRK